MINSKVQVIRQAVAEGTGAEIEIRVDSGGLQTGVQIWFSDLGRSNGPSIRLRPYGLLRHRVTLSFGSFSGPILQQIIEANDEEVQLARALLKTVEGHAAVSFSGDAEINNWKITGPEFQIKAERKRIQSQLDDDALEVTCRQIVVPIMAAMAELIGYDEILPEEIDDTPAWEGAVRQSVIKRRERNPRNRLLCLRLHGYHCSICNSDPREKYGDAGAILEVHHLEPLALAEVPRPYDPETDLIPLCPCCHRAIHSRRPVPWTPAEIKARITNV